MKKSILKELSKNAIAQGKVASEYLDAKKASRIIALLKMFFTRKGKPDALRFWITVFVVLCIVIIVIKIARSEYFSDGFMQSVFAFTGVLLGADTWSTYSRRRYPTDVSSDAEEPTR